MLYNLPNTNIITQIKMPKIVSYKLAPHEYFFNSLCDCAAHHDVVPAGIGTKKLMTRSAVESLCQGSYYIVNFLYDYAGNQLVSNNLSRIGEAYK